MTDWYYHAPGHGRVGPLTAAGVVAAFRERRIDAETLVWHDGLREWQPLLRQFEALGLDGVRPDAALPPPAHTRAVPGSGSAQAIGASARTAPARSERSGCLIAVLIAAGVGVVAIAILAAIALPAYRDYADRARAARAGGNGAPVFDLDDIARAGEQIRALLAAAGTVDATSAECPGDFELESAQVRHPDLSGPFVLTPEGDAGGVCRYRATLPAFGPRRERLSLHYAVRGRGDAARVTCTAPDVPPPLRPPDCTD